mgnify:CR=1 FL=1
MLQRERRRREAGGRQAADAASNGGDPNGIQGNPENQEEVKVRRNGVEREP